MPSGRTARGIAGVLSLDQSAESPNNGQVYIYIGGFNKSEDLMSLEHRSRRSTPSIVAKIAIDRTERHIEMD